VKLPDSNPTTCLEDELLLCCARVSLSADVRERVDQLLNEQIDWQIVLNRSWWHRIRPLIYRHLSAQPAGRVPVAFLEIMKGYVNELKQRNQQLMNMLHQVAELFEESSLPLLVFKGPTLASDAYGDLSLRECGDLDLLIRADDFPRVKERLTSEGFACLWDQDSSERKRQLFACEFKRDGIELDVHWDLAPGWHNYCVDFDQLWDSGQPLAKHHQMARKLQPEDAIEILCMHGARHWWERLRWICDIAELVNSGCIRDWDRVKATATQARCHRSVLLGLKLASELLGATMPPKVQQELDRSPVVKQLSAQVGGWLANAEQAGEERKLPGRFLFRMRLCDRWRDRIPQIAHYLATLPSRSVNWNP
jgi:hypothetical protein